MVRETGLEPACCHQHTDLNRARLPIPPFPHKVVDGGGFEPPKSATADLQSAPFGHSGTYPRFVLLCHRRWSWRWDLNPQPADYKSAALPIELRQPIVRLTVIAIRQTVCGFFRITHRAGNNYYYTHLPGNVNRFFKKNRDFCKFLCL